MKEAYRKWLMSNNQRQSKELNQLSAWKRSKELMVMSKTDIRVVVGLLTGHSPLKRHLSLMGVINDPTCRGCQETEETSSHILCECDYFSAQRFEYLGRHIIEPWELSNIPAKLLKKFISATGLLITK